MERLYQQQLYCDTSVGRLQQHSQEHPSGTHGSKFCNECGEPTEKHPRPSLFDFLIQYFGQADLQAFALVLQWRDRHLLWLKSQSKLHLKEHNTDSDPRYPVTPLDILQAKAFHRFTITVSKGTHGANMLAWRSYKKEKLVP